MRTWMLAVVMLVACGSQVNLCRSSSECSLKEVCSDGLCALVRDAGVDGGRTSDREDGGLDDSGVADAGEAVGACERRTCADLGARCGSVSDGCGGMLACGSCPAPTQCGANHHCGCVPKTCAELGATCGTNVPDGCGGVIPSCGADPSCASAGPSWRCGTDFSCTCTPKTCATLGATCGVNLPDGCGGSIPVCGAGASCGGGQNSCDPTTHQCGCKPKTCADLGATCGVGLPDGCGGSLTCGDGLLCGGGQHFCDAATHHCACRPMTCADLGATCGVNLPDGCGGVISSCGSGASCGDFATCTPQHQCACHSTVDEPDDLFQDTNCDGIDGDASASVFVSTSGDDSNPGTRSAPVATLAHAQEVARVTGKHFVLVMAGTYVAPALWVDALNLIGGYDAHWGRSAALNARAVLNAPWYGMLVRNVSWPMTLESVVIRGAAPFIEGTGAQALTIMNAQGNLVHLRHLELVAADGLIGRAGTPGAPGLDGQAGAPGVNGVPGASAVGAFGGAPGAPGGSAPQGGAAGAAGETSPSCTQVPANAGHDGSAGLIGREGTPGTLVFPQYEDQRYGVIQMNGAWGNPQLQGGVGTEGTPGTPGGGGGGGAMILCGSHPKGGPGGAGGLGGGAGHGGTGGFSGGASIPLAVFLANVVLKDVSLRAGKPGAGGPGGKGGSGGAGGVGGTGGRGETGLGGADEGARGGAGGTGGSGGAGGAGGPGLPGFSFGIFCQGGTFSGELPTIVVDSQGPSLTTWGCH